jgi:hypothetical protein
VAASQERIKNWPGILRKGMSACQDKNRIKIMNFVLRYKAMIGRLEYGIMRPRRDDSDLSTGFHEYGQAKIPPTPL